MGKMNRREFLNNAAVVTGVAALPAEDLIYKPQLILRSGFSILQGYTNQTSAQFTIDLPRSLVVRYEAYDPETGRRFTPVLRTPNTRDFSDMRVDKIVFDNLYLN